MEEGEEVDTPPSTQDKAEIEKLEEQKLKSKFPGMEKNPLPLSDANYGGLLGQ